MCHVYEPAGNDNAREGARLAFGSYATAVYDFSKAEVIVSLDSDFLACGPASLRYSRDFSARRRLEHGKQTTSRLYVVESSVSSTGSVADNRLPMRPTEIENFARALAAGFGSSVQQGNLSDAHRRWVGAIVKDLNAHRGTSLVIAGDSQPPFIHALAHSINQQLGNVGQTVTFVEPVEGNPVAGTASLQELMGDINAGTVNTLLILGGNPVYTAPADFNFAEAMKKVPLRIHLGLYQDETSELCHWHIPEAHYLESWGDARAYNGLVSIIQPLIAPIYSGKTAHEVVAAFSDQGAGQTGYQLIQDYWRRFFEGGRREPAPPAAARTTQAAAAAQSQIASSQSGGAAASQPQPATGAQPAAATNAQSTTGGSAPAGGTANTEFDRFWRRALHDGFIAGTERQPKTASVGAIQAPPLVTSSADAIEIVFRPDPTIYDGRFANNGWLQELPKPITTLVWDNAAIMSPATAARLNLGSVSGGMSTNRVGSIGGEFFADMIELTIDGRSQAFPAWIQPGHPNDTVTVHLGYGRRRAGRVGLGLGFNAYAIRSSGAQWSARGVQVRATGDTYPIVAAQLHHLIDPQEVGTRDLVRSGTFEEYKKNPSLVHLRHEEAESPHDKHEKAEHHPSLLPEYDYSKGYKWGMAIDLNSCIGCHACVVACQAENNIPVIGKDQMARRRGMHWLRVDAYYKGGVENPQTYFQPVTCQQCEKAPCEIVCPVAATAHSAEGLNDMVYNRCVGTRYCSNNCPYKVRRFNFLLYQDFYTASLKMLRNPDVSVRSRGVMEKCTYCVQRIQEAKIESEKQNRRVEDGEVITACAAACPTEAIVFGDINDTNSRVHRLKNEERNYSLLSLLNTAPRTTYLAAVRNPNPELEEA
jgi:molybdopterin-containing oxidoreductase family iron-sulfur binding subunit